ncbi:MAG: hypothetical protein IJL05_03635 [Alphaproteobacteria bacterium]|nr:hypothetical protein [Alphaproteobacteria bacterium]
MNKSIPAFYRQDEIKANIKKEKMTKYLIDLNDKNIPAVIRKEIGDEIGSNPELQMYVLKHQVSLFAEQTKQLLADVCALRRSLGK